MNEFNIKELYNLLRTIPQGKVTTYGRLAEMMGNKKWCRAVGNALHKNTNSTQYPCYKVVNSKGELSRSYAFGGIEEQKRRLEADGIIVVDYKVDLELFVF